MNDQRVPKHHRWRRRLLIYVPIIAVLVFLLWPLGSRDWTIREDQDRLQDKKDRLSGQRAVGRRSPRIILIVADDIGPTDLGLYGGTRVPTPNIDSIGRQGVTFTDASCTTAICAPSRASMLTGRYQQRFGFEFQPHDRYARSRLEYAAFRYFINTSPMRPIAPSPIPTRSAIKDQGMPGSEVMISELLSARGYRTAIFGKWHLGYSPQFSPLEHGFDEFFGFYEAFSLYAPVDDPGIVNTPIDDFSDRHMWNQERDGASAIVHNDLVVDEDDYLTFRFAELAADYVRGNADEPYFLYVPFNAPHTPLQAPAAYVERLSSIEDPVHRTYYAMIAALDDAVGTILEAVNDSGTADSTLVIFTSDNGGLTYMGVTDNGPYAGGKFSTFEGGLSVPLMMRFPGVLSPGSVYDRPVSLLDIFATIDAASMTIPGLGAGNPEMEDPGPVTEDTDGANLIPYVTGRLDSSPHETLYFRSGYNRAIRHDRWKLLVQGPESPGTANAGEVFLFDLDADPYEKSNVAQAHPGVVDKLLGDLATWELELRPPAWPPVMHVWLDVWGRKFWFAI